MCYLQSIVTRLLCVVLLASAVTSCRTTPTNPDTFFNVVVTCTQENSSNTQAGAAVVRCLTGAVQNDFGACLSGLVTAGYWTVDEVACIVRRYATESAQRINAGTPAADDSVLLKNANEWIRSNKVAYR